MSAGPDIASLLAQASSQGGAPPQGPQDVATPGDTQDPSGGGSGDQGAADLIKQILDLIAQAKQIEPDEEDKLQFEQVGTLLQKLLAKDQKEADGLLQGKMTPAAMRSALGG